MTPPSQSDVRFLEQIQFRSDLEKMNCSNISSFDRAMKLYDEYRDSEEYAGCLVNMAGNIVQARIVTNSLVPIRVKTGLASMESLGLHRLFLLDEAEAKWRRMSADAIEKVSDCKSAKDLINEVESSFRQKALIKLALLCDGIGRVGEKEGGR